MCVSEVVSFVLEHAGFRYEVYFDLQCSRRPIITVPSEMSEICIFG